MDRFRRMDRISSLPDEIICHIVSFLSAKEAAFVLVLSKRFRNLYTIIPILEFDRMVKNQGSFTDFLDGVLALPASSRIRKFSIYCYSTVKPAHYAHINLCLCDVLKRGLMDLKLDIYVEGGGYSLPLEVFTCKTVVKLELGRHSVIDFVPENALLPALKTLFLRSVRFYDLCGCSFHKLLSACPALEDLTIQGVDWEQWKWSRTVCSPSLQRLTIQRQNYEDFDGSDFKSITFNTPSLNYLHYQDFLPEEHPTVNFNSLVEANLAVTLTVDHAHQGVVVEDDPITSDPTNLIMGLRNVQILKLLSTDTTDVFDIFRDAVPVFESLRYLSFDVRDTLQCWPFFPLLLKKSPNLKTLVIDGPVHCSESDNQEPDYVCECLSGYSCLWSCPMEVLEINSYGGDVDELEQLKHFLGKLSCLKMVKVYVRARNDKEKLQITTDLLMIPRASVNCKIQVKFFR